MVSPSGVATGVTQVRVEVDVTGTAPVGCTQVVCDLLVPDVPNRSRLLWCCVPGGGMSRKYFDLEVPGSGASFSMARNLAALGHHVLIIDPPGVGESDVPDDPCDLSPRTVATVLNVAVEEVRSRLMSGELGRLAPDGPTATLGVGHSAGGLLVACQQAHHGTYEILALLGFSGSGLPGVLTEQELALSDRPQQLEAMLPDLAMARFGSALPEWTEPAPDVLLIGTSSDEAKAAAAEAGSRLLGLVGLTCLVPGSVARELEVLQTPIFCAVGEHDIAGPAQDLARQLPGCSDLTLVTIPGIGHNHNTTDARVRLWDRMERWASSSLLT